MKILIREGSAAKNFEELVYLLNDFAGKIMFCSDDKHPDSLLISHINDHVRRAVAKGIDVFAVLEAACIIPVRHYNLEVGLLKVNDRADFVVVNNLKDFKVLETYIDGNLVAKDGKSLISIPQVTPINKFESLPKIPADFRVAGPGNKIRVIEALDGQLITNELEATIPVDEEGFYIADPENDILKLVVVNRYNNSSPVVAFIKNFGLKKGAIASSVAHDSHNIIAVGADDASIAKAINLIINEKGGIVAVCENQQQLIPLPVAGLMSTADGYEVASAYILIDKMAKEMGSKLQSPFMTLSFMALLVIPSLKLSDKGLFNGQKFTFTPLSK